MIGGSLVKTNRYSSLTKLLLLLPALVVIIITSTYPILYVFWLGFQRWMVWESPIPQCFVGFNNFINAFKDPLFHEVIVNTGVYTIISVSLSVGIGLAIAMLLQKPSRINQILKMSLIFPFAVSPALKGFTFKFMLNPSFGILDRIIKTILPFLEKCSMA